MSVVAAQGISKSYGGVPVLKNVNLTLRAGHVTGLVGENGAGKSTLIKVLTGLVRPDSGSILVDDEAQSHWSRHHAVEAGISVIHQELLLVPELTVAQNILLGEPPLRGGALGRALGLRDDAAAERRSAELLSAIGITGIDVCARAHTVSPSHAQMILIARALRRQARVLILDEPTAALARGERDDLFALLRRLVARGTAILLVSHHLHEVEELADAVTVLRNGEVVAELTGSGINIATMIRAMLDRSLEDQFPPVHHVPADEVVLEARNLTLPPTLRGVDVTVRRGEILGITGLLGAGKTELAQALVGLGASRAEVVLTPEQSGTPREAGHRYVPKGPREAIRRGVLLVPEERKAQAIFPDMSVYHNGVVAMLSRGVSQGGASSLLPRSKAVGAVFKRTIGGLGVKYTSENQPAGRLSGGNQQKLVIGRALACQPKVLVLDEPTRGIDVGSKREIYRIIVEQAEAGLGVVLISSDTREVLALAHRVMVLRNGVMTALIDPSDHTNEELTMLLSPEEVPDVEEHGAGQE